MGTDTDCGVHGEDARGGIEERIWIQSARLDGQVPASEVLVAPWGEVESLNGRFVVDEESARMVVEAFKSHGTDIPVDYEHQSLGGDYASPNGQAPAAGWIRGLRSVSPESGSGRPGLFAEVEWTESATKKLQAREYRYLSPVVLVRKSDRRVVALHSVALTNKPAIVGMKPIVNRESTAENADSCQVEPPRIGSAAVERLRARLGMESDQDVDAVLCAAESKLACLLDDCVRREAERQVEAAVRAGKLAAAQHEWAMSLAMKEPQVFAEWLATAPVLVVPGRIAPPRAGSEGHRREAVVASARAAFRSQPELASITSEDAWVRDALREAGFETIVG